MAPDLIEESGVWSAQDTTPADIEAALRRLLAEAQHQGEAPHAPARVLNLVAVVDREWKGEIANRLERVGRYQPSRTVICAVEPGRTTLDAWASMSCEIADDPGALALCLEEVEVDVGPEHLANLVSVVDPLVVSDLVTVVWAPHGHEEAVSSLLGIAEVVLLDSVQEPEPRAALEKAAAFAESAYVVDLAWLRGTPWRERIAATFDPPAWRPQLAELSAVTVRHREGSEVSAALVLGWLASRLGWVPRALEPRNGHLRAPAWAGGRDVELTLEPVSGLDVPGLAGMTVETASGASLSLDRGSGGLNATRRRADGAEASWTVLGASRGEAGILGEGIRQALLRDPTYAPALSAARTLLR